MQLVAERLDGLGRRPDEDEARGDRCPGEGGSLGEEAVPRMDGVRTGCRRGSEDRADVEVALGRRRWTDAHRSVGEPDMCGAGVGVAEDRHSLETQIATGPDDP